MTQKIKRNLRWLMADRAAFFVNEIFVTALVARWLGPGQFGVLMTALAVFRLTLPLARLGLNAVVVRELVSGDWLRRELLTSALWITSLSSLLAFAAASVIIRFIVPQDSDARLSAYIIVIALLATPFLLGIYEEESRTDVRVSVGANVSTLIALAGLRFMSVLGGHGVAVFAVFYLVQNAFPRIVSYTVQRLAKRVDIGGRLVHKTASRLLSEGGPLMIAALANAAAMNMDVLMLGWMLGVDAVGVYSVAARLSVALYFLPAAFAKSYFPEIVRAKTESRIKEQAAVEHFFSIMARVGLAVTVVAFLVGPPVIQILYGPKFLAATLIFQLHVLTLFLMFLVVARHQVLLVRELGRFVMYLGLLALPINFVCNLVLINWFGMFGAALATVGTQAFLGWFGLYIFSETRELAGEIWKPLIPRRRKR